MSDKKSHSSCGSRSIKDDIVSIPVTTVPNVSPSIPTATAEPVLAGPRPLHPEHSKRGDGVHDNQIEYLGTQAVVEHNKDDAGRQDATYQPSPVESTFIPPPPPPPPASSTGFFVPPPPPTSGGNIAGLAPVATWSVDAEKLDREQEELRDCRDEVLGSRFRVAEMRKELRDLHIETSAKGGSVFNLLRQYLHTNHTGLPTNIEEAFNEASMLRDRLGLLEAKYDAAEANYNTLEWNYSNKEARFVEEALRNKLVPIGTVSRSRSADDMNIAQLTRGMIDRTREPPAAWNHTAYHDTGDSEDDTSAPTKSDQQQGLGEELQLSRRDVSYDSDHAAISPIRKEADQLRKKQEHTRWLQKMKRIDAWLLETVDDSRLLQAYLKAIYDVGYSDDDQWWEHTSQLLTENHDELPFFRTGDSTVSHQTTSKPSTPQIVNASSRDLPILEIGSTTPLVSEDHQIARPAVSEHPIRVESGDLLHSSERGFATLNPPARSVSESSNSYMTSESPSRRTSCSEIADAQSDATSQYSETRNLPVDHTRTNREYVGQSTPTTPTQRSQHNSTSSTPDPSHHLDNGHRVRRGTQPNSALLTSCLASLPTSADQLLSQEDSPQTSETEQPLSESRKTRREPSFAQNLELSPTNTPTKPPIKPAQSNDNGCSVM